MKQLVPVALGLALVALSADSAFAQRGRSTNISTPFGTFSHNEMMAAGNDPSMALQMRQQNQQMQMQQQMFKQQQQAMQQQQKYAEFLKKNPDAAKMLNATAAKTAPKKLSRADRDKLKRENGELPRTTTTRSTTTPATSTAADPAVSPLDTKPAATPGKLSAARAGK